MSLFILTCPALVDTFIIGTHILFFLSIYIVPFLTFHHLTVARPLPPLIGLETSFYRVFLAIASGLSVLTFLTSGLSIYTHSIPVLTFLTSGLSIYTHSIPVLTFFVSYSLVARTPILPLHLF